MEIKFVKYWDLPYTRPNYNKVSIEINGEERGIIHLTASEFYKLEDDLKDHSNITFGPYRNHMDELEERMRRLPDEERHLVCNLLKSPEDEPKP